MELTFLGQSCFLLSFKKTKILIDPYLKRKSNGTLEATFTPPHTKNSIKDISLILLTHEHFDHFDKEDIEHIAKRDNAVVVAHDSLLSELTLPRNLLRPISVGKKESLRNVEIEALPAHHPNSFYPLSYLVHADKKRIFHAGDTALMDHFSDLTADVALLPIGGTYTMDLIDAVRATKTIKPDIVIPMHYNTFDVIKADPNEFKQRIEKSILKTKPVILSPGEKYKYPK